MMLLGFGLYSAGFQMCLVLCLSRVTVMCGVPYVEKGAIEIASSTRCASSNAWPHF